MDLEVQFPVPVSALALTPVSGELASSSGISGYLTYVAYTYIHAHTSFFKEVWGYSLVIEGVLAHTGL